MLQRSTVKVFILTLGVSHEHLEVVNDCDEIYRGDHRKHDELLPTVHGRSSEHGIQRLGKVAEACYSLGLVYQEQRHLWPSWLNWLDTIARLLCLAEVTCSSAVGKWV